MNFRRDSCMHGFEWGYVRGGDCPICQKLPWGFEMNNEGILSVSLQELAQMLGIKDLVIEDVHVSAPGDPFFHARPVMDNKPWLYLKTRHPLNGANHAGCPIAIEPLAEFRARVPVITQTPPPGTVVDPLIPIQEGETTYIDTAAGHEKRRARAYERVGPTNCDLSEVSLQEAALKVGPSFVYDLHVSGERVYSAQRLCKDAQYPDNPLLPHINVVLHTGDLKTDEWYLEANGKRVGSPGAM